MLQDVDFKVCYTDIGNAVGTNRICDFMRDEIGLPYQVVQMEYNYSRCNNFLACMSESEYLLFLNDDIEFNDDALTTMLNVLEHDESIGQVGLKLLYPDGLIQHYGQLLLVDQIGKFVGITHYRLRECDTYQNDIYAQGVTAACCMVRKRDFDLIGGFDEGYEVAFQDVQLSWDIRKIGKDIICIGSHNAMHHESISRGKGSVRNVDVDRMVQHYNENRDSILDGKDGRYWTTILEVRR